MYQADSTTRSGSDNIHYYLDTEQSRYVTELPPVYAYTDTTAFAVMPDGGLDMDGLAMSNTTGAIGMGIGMERSLPFTMLPTAVDAPEYSTGVCSRVPALVRATTCYAPQYTMPTTHTPVPSDTSHNSESDLESRTGASATGALPKSTKAAPKKRAKTKNAAPIMRLRVRGPYACDYTSLDGKFKCWKTYKQERGLLYHQERGTCTYPGAISRALPQPTPAPPMSGRVTRAQSQQSTTTSSPTRSDFESSTTAATPAHEGNAYGDAPASHSRRPAPIVAANLTPAADSPWSWSPLPSPSYDMLYNPSPDTSYFRRSSPCLPFFPSSASLVPLSSYTPANPLHHLIPAHEDTPASQDPNTWTTKSSIQAMPQQCDMVRYAPNYGHANTSAMNSYSAAPIQPAPINALSLTLPYQGWQVDPYMEDYVYGGTTNAGSSLAQEVRPSEEWTQEYFSFEPHM